MHIEKPAMKYFLINSFKIEMLQQSAPIKIDQSAAFIVIVNSLSVTI